MRRSHMPPLRGKIRCGTKTQSSISCTSSRSSIPTTTGSATFRDFISKLDYIANLGVNTIWLLPFYPSPRLDDGYDISEYRGVHPDYDTHLAFPAFRERRARWREIRVITELVINHTSDQHAWFQRARRAKANSIWRHFYVWSDNDQKYVGTRIIFVDTERSNWTWDRLPARITGIGSIRTAGPQFRQPACAQGHARCHAFLAANGRGRVALRCRSISRGA